MIEAFEIGVSLALRDGVSDGLAAARRDIAMIETAIRTNGVSLEALRRAGDRVLQTTHAARPAERADGGIAGGVAKAGGASTRGLDRAAPGPIADPQTGSNAITPPEVVTVGPDLIAAGPSAFRPLAALMDGGRPPAPTVTQSLPTATAPGQREAGFAAEKLVPVQTPGMRGDGRPTGVPRAAAGTTPPGQRVPVSPTGNGAAPAGPTAPLRVQIDATSPRAAIYRPIQARLPEATAPAGPLAREGLNTTQPGMGAGDAAQWPAAPDNLAATPAAPQAARNPAGATRTDDKAQGDTVPVQGDVFLDGVLVGRWMCRFLTRQAARDPAGPTGFDPRRNPVLPGATIGLS